MISERIIHPEWDKILVCLQMSVLNHWGEGYKGNQLYQGLKVIFVEDTNKWQLLVDDQNNPTQYAMNCKGVCECANIEASTYLY